MSIFTEKMDTRNSLAFFLALKKYRLSQMLARRLENKILSN